LGGYGLALSGQTSRTCARTRAMASRHSGAMPVQTHNDYEINRKAEEDGGFAGLKSCATCEVLRHVRSAARPSRESSGNRALLSPAIWRDVHR